MAAACAMTKGRIPPRSESRPLFPREYYAGGGKLGTAFNTTSVAYEQPTPVVDDDAAMTQRFLNGEALFENPSRPTRRVCATASPLYIRTSCLHCHPGYGHGKRIEGAFNTNQIGNGYLLVITDEDDNYLTSLTGMPQTRAVAPFKVPRSTNRRS